MALLLPSIGCGSALYLAVNGISPRPPVEVFECARNQIAVLGYDQTSINVEAHRVTARKYDWETRFADSRFRRVIERLSIEIGKAEAGAQLKIGAHTFAELMTQRGPTEVEQRASAGVKAAAQAIMNVCGN